MKNGCKHSSSIIRDPDAPRIASVRQSVFGMTKSRTPSAATMMQTPDASQSRPKTSSKSVPSRLSVAKAQERPSVFGHQLNQEGLAG